MDASRTGQLAVALITTSIGLIVVTGLLGPSVTEPPLPGRQRALPSFFVVTRPSPWLICALMLAFVCLGAWGTHLGLRAAANGWQPNLARLIVGAVIGCVAVVLVPPMGSGDILQYAAYGRIAAHYHGDVYSVTPQDITTVTHDPVTAAVEPPWQDTPSVYGPIATWVQQFASWVGRDSVHLTVWILQAANVLAFVIAGLLAIKLAGLDPAARLRSVLCVLANPVLIWAVVAGGHNDAQAAVFGVAALLLLRRSPLVAGALLGLAGSVKLSLAFYGLAFLWALRGSRRGLGELCAGAGVVMAALYLTTSPYAFNPVLTASKFMSTGTPAKMLYQPFVLVFSDDLSRRITSVIAWLVFIVIVAMLMQVVPAAVAQRRSPDTTARQRRDAGASRHHGDQVVADGIRASVAITLVWILTAMYSLPWYDVVTWLPMAGLVVTRLDRLLLARTAVMAAAYIPGRNVALPPALGFLTDHIRDTVAPVLELVIVVLLVRWCLQQGAQGPRGMWRAIRAKRWRQLYRLLPVRVSEPRPKLSPPTTG